MAELQATAMTMVNGATEEVLAALTDYVETRPGLLTREFGGYEVRAGGQGTGTEVRWTLALEEAIRTKKGRKHKKQKSPPWDCVMRVEVTEDGLVERDTQSELVVNWVLRDSGDGRTAVRVDATWTGPDGLRKTMARPKQQLAIRTVYEGLLTELHDMFEPEPPPIDADEDDTAEPEKPDAEPTATEPEQPDSTEHPNKSEEIDKPARD
jgi:hypothetical protein